MAPPRKISLPPPLPPAALEDSTLMMQLDTELLEEIQEVASGGGDAPVSMREPTPVPGASTESAELPSIPRMPKLPGTSKPQADLDELPDLSDLQFGDMVEPSAEPPAPLDVEGEQSASGRDD